MVKSFEGDLHHSFSCSLVRTPREGVLDLGKLFFIFIRFFFIPSMVLVTLKTISSLARIQTVAIDKNSTTADAYQLLRKCVCVPMNSLEDTLCFIQAKIIKQNMKDSDDVSAEFYQDFCHCHKAIGTMNFM